MEYAAVPSLEHRALVRIVVLLFEPLEVTSLMSKTKPVFGRERSARKLWQKIKDKIQKLKLPNLLKLKLLTFVLGIGHQVLRWELCLDFFFSKWTLKQEVSPFFCTPRGTVDKKRAAEGLVRNENSDVYSRFKLACLFCLDSHIHTLWDQLNEDERSGESIGWAADEHLVSFWTHFMIGDMEQQDWSVYCVNDTPYEYGFRHSTATGNEVGARYFFQKLTLDQRAKILVPHTKYVAARYWVAFRFRLPLWWYYNEVLCFLLSVMNEKQQMDILKNYMYVMLSSLLTWPWQDSFMPIVQRVWTFMSTTDYSKLLRDISHKISSCSGDYDYKKLITKFWRQSLPNHKSYVLSECGSALALLLLNLHNRECLFSILKDASPDVKERAIYSAINQSIHVWLACDTEWNLDEFLIYEFLSSEAITNLKYAFEMQLRHVCLKGTPEEQKCEMFLKLLDELSQSVCDRNILLS